MSAVRILVVEDDPNVRGLLQTLLEVEGYAVVTASDGMDGLGQAAASSPGLVLLDLVMPDLGGVRVLGFSKTTATALPSSGRASSAPVLSSAASARTSACSSGVRSSSARK